MYIQELEGPGQEVLEIIEEIGSILGINQQLRPAELQLQNFQYVGTNIGIHTLVTCVLFILLLSPIYSAMNIECEENPATGYEHVFLFEGMQRS